MPSGAAEWDFPKFFYRSFFNIAFFCRAQPTLKVLASQLIPVKSENGTRSTGLLKHLIFQIRGIAGYNAVKLDMPKYLAIHPIVSTSMVKKYHSRDGTVPPVLINNTVEWEVDSIINHNIFGKKKDTKVEFQVKWKGDAKDSWHEFADFEGCIDTFEKYLLQNCSLVKRSQILKLLSAPQLKMLSDTVKLTL